MKSIYYSAALLLTFGITSCSNETKSEAKEKTQDESVSYETATTIEANAPKETSFTVAGNLTEGASQKIFLYYFSSQNPTVIDSTVIAEDGSFELKGTGKGYQFYAVGSTPQKIKLLLLNSTETVSVNGNYNDLLATTIEGSEDSKIIAEYVDYQTNFGKKMKALENEFKALPNNGDNPEGQVLIKQSRISTDEFSAFVESFIDNNINSPAILMTAGDLFNPKTQIEYLSKIEHTLSKTMNGSQFHKNIVASLAQVKQQQKQQMQQAQQQQAPKELINIGMLAPELDFSSPTGQNIKLSSLKGKVVLIDFWASWCKPCRMENPNVVKLYNQYKDKGFTIYSVSLDKQKDRWVNAIQQDGLAWPNHVSDLKGWQSAASAKYGVNGIPYTVLIDKDGKVIATKLRGEQLAQKLKEILG